MPCLLPQCICMYKLISTDMRVMCMHTNQTAIFSLCLMIALEQEALLLDLLRVISHHRARLATPIRTVQKTYNEAELEDVPFADTIFRRSGAATSRPLLLIEPSYKINGDEKVKASTHANEDFMEETTATSDSKANTKSIYSKGDKVTASSPSNSSSSSGVSSSEAQGGNLISDGSVEVSTEKQFNDSRGETLKATSSGRVMISEKSPVVSPQSAIVESEVPSTSSQAKQEVDRSVAMPSAGRPSLEENIVLGVALEGSKLTLPIEEEIAPSTSSTESKELGAHLSGSASHLVGKDKKDGQMPVVHGGTQNN